MKKKLEYFNRLEIFKNSLSNLSSYEIENLVEHSMCTNVLNTYDEVVAWAEKIKKQFNTEIKEIPLGNLQNWNVNSNKIAHSSGKFYFKRNKGLVKQVDYENTYLLDESFMWLSLFQIKKLLQKNSLVNPHLSRLIFL